ncbi:unnamed protein product [Rotaria sp. Silwood2]|nr:unnamed protein product [Rotaria sp. Silwood2]CAF3449787.1 unnamed protein product [Rotaria sp. Silwood2]CAF4523202.1 unnamed protein product [Rotaria sp. Silwood2]CAF4587431.1 unnamed protein product [Rotaria sp. Silwood2]
MTLARYHLAKFDYCQALNDCEMSENRCQSGSIKLASIHECFGDIFYEMGQLDKAISYYRSSIDIVLKFSAQSKPLLSRLYQSIARVCVDKRQLREALQNLEQGLKLAPENSIIMAQLHQTKAGVSIKLKQFESAEEHLNQAKILFSKLSSDENIHIANDLRIRGRLNFHKGKFDIALQNLTEALVILEKELPKYHSITSETYIDIGRIYEKLNKMDEALEMFEKVKTTLHERLNNTEQTLDSAETSLSKCCSILCTIYDALANIHTKRRNFNQAHVEIKNGSLLRQKFCPNDLPLSNFNLANVYTQENRTKEAIDLLDGITDNFFFFCI